MIEASLDDLRALALDAARAAGDLLIHGRPDSLQVDTKTSPTDVVTEMDRKAEALLVEHLLGARPEDGVLGEEGGERTGTSGVRWVLDPIDGTVNYLYGIPHWAVCVAAEVDGVVEVGVVFDPTKGDEYVAVRGQGATRGGSELRVSEVTDLTQALIGTGFAYAVSTRTEQATAIADVLPKVRDIRRAGAASLDLCAVAAATLDGYFERTLQAWDLAAAGLIAQEAGAVVAGLDGQPAGPDIVIAANAALFPELHDLLAPLHPQLRRNA